MYSSEKEIVKNAYNAMMYAAATCDRWARESRTNGWSTHQVKANQELANTLRREAATLGPYFE